MKRYAWGNRQVTDGLNGTYADFMMKYIKGDWSFVCFDNHTFSVWLAYGYHRKNNACYLPFNFRNMKINVVDYNKYDFDILMGGFTTIRKDISLGKYKM